MSIEVASQTARRTNMDEFKREKGAYEISTDPGLIDFEAVHSYLRRSYWAEGIPKEILRKAIESSLCFSLFDSRCQIGFARVVTDRATFAYLCDVYILEEYRGRGLGKWLIEELLSHPDLQGLRRFVLITRNAHGLYERFGFAILGNDRRYMEIVRPNAYKEMAS
jgi:ribosomal protein S18 acetylase RimI-like enzyme